MLHFQKLVQRAFHAVLVQVLHYHRQGEHVDDYHGEPGQETECDARFERDTEWQEDYGERHFAGPCASYGRAWDELYYRYRSLEDHHEEQVVQRIAGYRYAYCFREEKPFEPLGHPCESGYGDNLPFD